MSVVYCGAPKHIYICNTLPLDNRKIYLHTTLPYITWGFIWNPKIKMEIPIEIKNFELDSKIICIEKVQKFYHLKSQLRIWGKLPVSQYTRFEVLQKKE